MIFFTFLELPTFLALHVKTMVIVCCSSNNSTFDSVRFFYSAIFLKTSLPLTSPLDSNPLLSDHKTIVLTNTLMGRIIILIATFHSSDCLYSSIRFFMVSAIVYCSSNDIGFYGISGCLL